MSEDFLAPESLIRARIKDRVPGVAAIYHAADAAGLQEQAQRTPAVHVLYGGASPQAARNDHAAVRIRQTWTLVVAVRQSNPTDPSQARGTAGQIISAIIAALQGWRPSDDFSPLTLTTSPVRQDYGGGFAYLPLAFTTDVTITGESTP